MKHQPVEDFGKEEIVCENLAKGYRIVRVHVPGGYNMAVYLNTTMYPYNTKCLDKDWEQKEWVMIAEPHHTVIYQHEIDALYRMALSTIIEQYSTLLSFGFSFKKGILHYDSIA